MLFLDFLKWWYGPGWALRFKMLVEHFINTINYFSVGIILKTMFSPWRQIISSSRKDQSINSKFTAILDNIVSRTVGFFVRVFVLFAAVIILILVVIMNVVYVVVWPLLPLSSVVIITIGIVS